ncbi:MAG: hypothetical protein M1819_003394 [Sarea resinae]|nr:MAG: hypothetical protein M1819_003394 [Sarea resinae]
MLASACARRLSSRHSTWRSYVEISRFMRSSAALPIRACPLLQGRVPRSAIEGQCSSFHTSVSFHQEKQSLDFLEAYKKSFNFPIATHGIQELSALDPSSEAEVVIHGYLGSRADISKNLSFASLISKELDCSVQVVSTAKSPEGQQKPAHGQLRSLEENSPVIVRGLIKGREPSKADQDGPGTLKTSLGEVQKIQNVEVLLQDIQCLNEFPKDIILTEDTKFPPEQRHLQIKTDKSVRDALTFRAKAANLCRDELSNRFGFVEVETPLLFKSTPEGAREFLVPTRRKGLAYALPQSPQQYKQILMASGIPRYFQVAKCFRDEDLRADRQPEFTQVDLEMSFATGQDVMDCMEEVIKRLWAELLDIRTLPDTFPRMSYEEAMSRYGSDKPDIRLGMEIHKVDYLLPVDLVSKITPLPAPTVEILKLPLSTSPSETRDFINSFMGSPEAIPFNENPDGQPGIFVVDSRRPLSGLQAFGFEAAEHLEDLLSLEDGDVVVLQARKQAPHSGGSTALGNLRLALHRAAVAQGRIPAAKGFEFLWIADFPLFSPTVADEPGQGGAAGLASTHHPFTAPKTVEDVDLLLTDPSKVKAEHYDLVVNGVELGGGSRRIHDARVQEFILRDVLKISPNRLNSFSHLLSVLRSGCPPHAGIALGFDRLITVMMGRESVRDVIAFPKSGKGEDLLVKSPSMVDKEALEVYGLKLIE